ncbi:MAG TPA: chemotaxis protein CheB, partial [Phycisphaerales bacterium]|nr:chemotaxis protein CheB [Phycisphaerales bacterium]
MSGDGEQGGVGGDGAGGAGGAVETFDAPAARDRAAISGPGTGNEAAEGRVVAGRADRLAQPVLDEGAPRLPFTVVGIGASAGGLEACIEFVRNIPADDDTAYVVVQHLSPDKSSMVAEILAKHCPLPTTEIDDGMAVEPGRVYVIRPARTLIIESGRFVLSEPLQKRGHRHPIDDFFRSLAEEQRERAVAVVLSGMGSNGTAGAAVINTVGGLCIAQEPVTATHASMPQSLIDSHHADYILPPSQMPGMIRRYVAHPYTKSRRAELVAQRDNRAYDEIVSVLRSRTHQEFGGYKRATVLRRIQRRMGIHHTVDMTEYATLVRQNAAEARALAEEIVIHVTGFFRDPQAWETLRERVVEPLVAARVAAPRSADPLERPEIRAWVTACSTGEEPYTLAILLHEAVEKAGRRIGGAGGIDVKVFATDLVDRTIAYARNGAYPLGIEAEVRPDRLERYFDKDEVSYRVKKEVRELVVFAPQNVLQDPPFSRLDIVTCRNLLIYLEPQVQQRLLGLLHFGLRERGVLMLGNSETIGGAEDLFEPLDKKWRIYRKLGATRTGRIDFPTLLASVRRESAAAVTGQDAAPVGERGPAGFYPRPSAVPGPGRASIAQLAQRTLLERHTPPSVVIDRAQRIVYFHGDTSPFIAQPHGEPTRELLPLVRDGVRNAVRTALRRSMRAVKGSDGEDGGEAAGGDGAGTPVTVPDGLIVLRGERRRIEVTVAQLDPRAAGDLWLVSFEDHPADGPYGEGGAGADGGGSAAEQARSRELSSELGRVRDELQGTIIELQTSNEELKAANEEVTSINEELQSTNEELETSKEELQSYNEELSTVNTQLQGKMEELEAATNDLSSLL